MRATILEETQYIESSFSVIFPRQADIRLKINDFERKLKGHYGQPQIINIPDDIGPEAPRAIFISNDTYSQIVISQVNIVLTINFSVDLQYNENLRKNYVLEKSSLVFDMVNSIRIEGKQIKASYCGFTTTVHIPVNSKEISVIGLVSKLLNVDGDHRDIHDISRRVARIVKDKYFSNIVIENYRTWQFDIPTTSIIKLRNANIKEQGIQVIGDYNDKFAYQERSSYSTTKSEMNKVIEQGLKVIAQAVEEVRKDYE
jgi:hypothetical protein